MLTSPSGKAYIGQTAEKVLEKRLKKHRLLQGSRKCDKEVFMGEIPDRFFKCPDDELDKHEEMLIETLGTLSPGV